ncbi:3'-5' exonuclease [Pseudomonadota bacterium]
MYAHSSKGLEFPVVAIPGIGYLPNTHGELKDEVRLMYVGMTRAMDQLILTGHQDSTFGEMLARVV